MRARRLIASALTASLAAAACSETPAQVAGATEAAAGETSDDAWTAPRTPWGDPDLRGTWPLDSVSGTPFQRPQDLGEQAFLTDEQFDERLERQAVRAAAADEEEAAGKLGNGHWAEWDAPPLRQSSLIVEPANGRIPPLTDEGRARATTMRSSWSDGPFDDLSDFNALDRCITRGLPASMLPFPYNNGLEIHQSPDHVVLRMELVHETRVIPLDGRPPLPVTFEHWLGESRGSWEGETLVIETTNFNGESPMVIVGPSNAPVPTSTSLRITERLTLTGPDTIAYEAVVEDPVVLTGPWRMAFPLTRNEGYEIYEYACHEANTVIPAYIRATSPRFAELRGEQP